MKKGDKLRFNLLGIILLAALLLLPVSAAKEVARAVQVADFISVFFNDSAPAQEPNQNSGDILTGELVGDLLSPAPEEVRNDPSAHAEWFVNDLSSRVYNADDKTGDPVLTVQLALDAQERAPQTTGKLLDDDRTAEEWVKEIIAHPEEHIQIAGRLQAIWQNALVVSVEPLGEYISAGYQQRDGITLDSEASALVGRDKVPSPILMSSTSSGGYQIRFETARQEVLIYRINCGYQPLYEEDTPTPDIPTVTVPIQPSEPNKPTEPDKPDEPEELEPKNPNGGPQGQFPDHPDFGGGPNVEIDTTPTPEPVQPEEYTPPEEPTVPPDTIETPADNNESILDQYSPSNNDGQYKEETITVDTDGDGQGDKEFTGNVVVGPSPDKTLSEVHKNPPPVEENLTNSSTSSGGSANSGTIAAPK